MTATHKTKYNFHDTVYIMRVAEDRKPFIQAAMISKVMLEYLKTELVISYGLGWNGQIREVRSEADIYPTKEDCANATMQMMLL